MNIAKLRPYTLAELEQNPDHGPVWVRNASKGERRGDVCLTIARNNGIGSDSATVPSTWIPMDLTTIVSRPQLLRDNQFRQALAVRLLVLVHPEDAEALFEEDEDAQTERMRLSNYMLVGGVVWQQESVQSDVEVFSDKRSSNLSDMPGPVSDMIQRLENAHRDNELDDEMESTAASRLRNMGELPDEVLHRIYLRLTKVAPKVAQAAKKMRT